MTDELLAPQGADDRTATARRYLDSAEAWLRRIIHDGLSASEGDKYITNYGFDENLRKRVGKKLLKNPGSFPREVDATSFGDLVLIVSEPAHWPKWEDALAEAYPNGQAEAKTFLNRLQAIRNTVAHLRTCSTRQLERAICYTNDLVDSLKQHYRSKGMEKKFNVPVFIKFKDSIGNDEPLPMSASVLRNLDLSGDERPLLSYKDTLVIDVEVDPSYDPTTYDVIWWVKTAHETGSGTQAVIEIGYDHVGDRMELMFMLKTNNAWHRSGGFDDLLEIYYTVPVPQV